MMWKAIIFDMDGVVIDIEDAPHGVAAAKNAGMYCVALTTTRPREELGMADVVLDSYQDIKNHLLL